MCVDMMSTGLPIIKVLLEPFCHTLKEISVQPKNPALRVVKDNRIDDVDHAILYVKLHSNEDFVVDLTGAQYGWEEKLYTWRDYMRYRGDFRVGFDLGASRNHTTSLMEPLSPDSIVRSGCDIRRMIAQQVAQKIDDFFKAHGTTVNDFMASNSPDIPHLNLELINRANATIDQSIHDLILRSGIGRTCISFRGAYSRPIAVRTEELARRLARVWFTQDEVEACQGQFEALEREMQHRLYREEI
ncbi:unnamed protein product [Clonostachys rosea]|uniref:Uncharacterized protein n=1 Tax=Bionectria ochroleuca TaxID=29856 RepID=A0ABY6UDG1_BIOOC|nr:unnamed protein product [Clonostachys rosea]